MTETLTHQASAPPVLQFAGAWLPYAPLRVGVGVGRRTGEHRSRVRVGELSLLVDPSLDAPDHEGPLAPAGRALRAVGPLQTAVEVTADAAPSQPGAEVAMEQAVLGALARLEGVALPRAQPDGRAARDGHAVDGEGLPLETSPGLLALLEERLVLHRAPRPIEATGEGRPPGGSSWASPAVLAPADLDLLWGAVAGEGVDCDTPWARDLLEVLRAAGLHARWTLPGGCGLALVAPDRRQDLLDALSHHGFEPLPCSLTGVRGLKVEETK
jgi:hypothetical protein